MILQGIYFCRVGLVIADAENNASAFLGATFIELYNPYSCKNKTDNNITRNRGKNTVKQSLFSDSK